MLQPGVVRDRGLTGRVVMNKSTLALPRAFTWLNLTQFCGALNDNLLKLLIIFFLIAIQGPEAATSVGATTGAIFVVPFLLFTPLAGALADKFSKSTIIRSMKVSEVVITLLGAGAFALAEPAALYAVLFLMAAQSALFGPSKYGIVPELVTRQQLSRANSLIESMTYLAIIFGSALAPFLAQVSDNSYRLAAAVCILFSLTGFLTSFGIASTPAADRQRKLSPRVLKEAFASVAELRGDHYLMLALIGSAYFLFLGAFAQINLIPFGIEIHGLKQEQSGYLFLLAAIGIGLGSNMAGRMSGRNIELGLVPVGAFGLSASTIGLYLLPVNLFLHSFLIVLLGTSAGLFLVPLRAFVQLRAPRKTLGRILAAGSFMSWCGVLLASLMAFALSKGAGLTPDELFLVLGLMTLGLTLLSLKLLPDFLLRFVVLMLMRCVYRIRVDGAENVPDEGPALLIPNHVSWVDALLLLATQQRRIRFIMHRDIFNRRLLRPLFRLMGVIPVSAEDSRKEKLEFVKSARQALDEGYLVCIFAEGMITRTGMLQPFKSGFESLLKGCDHPLIPVHIGGVWGSIFSYANGGFLKRLPSRWPHPVAIRFGEVMAADSSALDVQQQVAELSCAYYDDKRSEETSLSAEFIKSARQNWSRNAISDSSGKALSFGRTLTATVLLAERLKPRLDEHRNIAVLIPPSVGGVLANLALAQLGRVPVNLNYSAAPATMRSAMQQSSCSTLLTSRAFLERFPETPMPDNVLYVEDLLEVPPFKEAAVCWIKARLLPRRMMLGRLQSRGDAVATLIFSSGSTGEPKGVVLTQHNILSNIEAIRTVAALNSEDRVCGALPFFHALGFTATLWLPLIGGFSAAYHNNPMEAGTICKMLRKQGSTLLLTTPTFLSAYMRRAKADDFSSLRLVVTGAEKLKATLAEAFNDKFSLMPLEGYGATELAPLISLNIPDVVDHNVQQPGRRQGSVGRAIPGVVIRVVAIDSARPVPAGEEGLIQVKGPNLMQGYLNRPEQTAEVISEGWYHSGDIGYLDRDGFLHITDRLARFSKIGGEMVPHGRVEDLFYQQLSLADGSLAVTSLSDAKKGERLIVLATSEAGALERLIDVSQNSALPNLWKPQRDDFVRVEQLPCLGSGKLDLRGLRKLAQSALEGTV